jgi:hypothetical protein
VTFSWSDTNLLSPSANGAPAQDDQGSVHPAHLLLGSYALSLVRDKLTTMAADIDTWESLTRSTDGQP